jgi:CRP-like cAMP-binding protein
MLGAGAAGRLTWINRARRLAPGQRPLQNAWDNPSMFDTGHIARHPESISPRRNHLLAVLTAAELEPLLPHMKLTGLPLGAVLYDPGSRMDDLYFPISGVVSLLYTLEDGHTTELAIVGNDGCVGIALLLGGETTPSQAVVQIAGYGYRVGSSVIVAEFRKGGGTSRVLLRYIQSLMTQMVQTAVCNRHHTVEQQLCRWLLLSLDRLSSNKVRMTQELISNMLGVRRAGITEAARKLQAAGVIEYARGHITVPDRAKLEAHACECYAVVKKETDRLDRAGLR